MKSLKREYRDIRDKWALTRRLTITECQSPSKAETKKVEAAIHSHFKCRKRQLVLDLGQTTDPTRHVISHHPVLVLGAVVAMVTVGRPSGLTQILEGAVGQTFLS